MFGMNLDGTSHVATREEVIEIAKNHLVSTGDRTARFEDLSTGHIHQVRQIGFASIDVNGARVSGNQFSVVNLTSSSCCPSGPSGTCDGDSYALLMQCNNADPLGGSSDAPQGTKYSTVIPLQRVDANYDYSPLYTGPQQPCWRGCQTIKAWGISDTNCDPPDLVHSPRNIDLPCVAEIICGNNAFPDSQGQGVQGPLLMFTFPLNSALCGGTDNAPSYPTSNRSVSSESLSGNWTCGNFSPSGITYDSGKPSNYAGLMVAAANNVNTGSGYQCDIGTTSGSQASIKGLVFQFGAPNNRFSEDFPGPGEVSAYISTYQGTYGMGSTTWTVICGSQGQGLTLTKKTDKSPPNYSIDGSQGPQTIIFTSTAVNGSQQTVTNLNMIDLVPTNAKFVGAQDGATPDSGNQVTWPIASLDPGMSFSKTLTMMATTIGDVVNTVSIGSTTAKATAHVLGPPTDCDVSVTIAANPGTQAANSPLQVTVTGKNSGPQGSQGTYMTLSLPSDAVLVSSDDNVPIVNGKLLWDLDYLDSGAQSIKNAVFDEPTEGKYRLTAVIGGNCTPPGNQGSQSTTVTITDIFGCDSTASPTQYNVDEILYGMNYTNDPGKTDQPYRAKGFSVQAYVNGESYGSPWNLQYYIDTPAGATGEKFYNWRGCQFVTAGNGIYAYKGGRLLQGLNIPTYIDLIEYNVWSPAPASRAFTARSTTLPYPSTVPGERGLMLIFSYWTQFPGNWNNADGLIPEVDMGDYASIPLQNYIGSGAPPLTNDDIAEWSNGQNTVVYVTYVPGCFARPVLALFESFYDCPATNRNDTYGSYTPSCSQIPDGSTITMPYIYGNNLPVQFCLYETGWTPPGSLYGSEITISGCNGIVPGLTSLKTPRRKLFL